MNLAFVGSGSKHFVTTQKTKVISSARSKSETAKCIEKAIIFPIQVSSTGCLTPLWVNPSVWGLLYRADMHGELQKVIDILL